LLEAIASLGQGSWHVERICAAAGAGVELGHAAQILAGLSAAGVCASGEDDFWISAIAPVELQRLAQLLKGAEHYRRLRSTGSSLELVVTMPLPPSRLEQELGSAAGRPGGYLSTAAAFTRIAQAASKRLVVLTPFIDWGGFLWLRRTLEAARAETEKILILRDAAEHAVELSVQHADWLRAMNVSVKDYNHAHEQTSGRALPLETFHAKVLLADESLAYVGSANFLGSSEAVTLETGVVVDGAAAVQVARLVSGVLRVARSI
jgi:hypothetical protein